MSDLVQFTNIDGIAVVTINNPPVNALSSAVSSGIAATVAQIEKDDSVIALRAVDVDIIYLNGYGFPAHRGGPMWYADTIGLKQVYEHVREFRQRLGNWWEPAPLLQRLAE